MRPLVHRLAAHLGGIVSAAATFGVTVALLMGAQVGTSAAANFTWSQSLGVPATPPSNAGSEPVAHFDWGDCPTVGSCVAVGSYTDKDGNREPMIASRTNGLWEQAVEIALPTGAATSAQEAGFVFSLPTVVCAEPGVCTAVGFYKKEGGGEGVMAVNQTGGVWGAASAITLPANAANNPEARLRSVTCPVLGSCVATGDYLDENGHREAMVVEETGGLWGQASELTLPGNAASNPMTQLYAVACSGLGSCVAVGEYHDGSTDTQEAMVVVESAGKWGQVSQVALPANAGSTPRSLLHSLACTAAGPCVAVGRYVESSGDQEAMVVEETGGLWGQAIELASPANAASNPEVVFGLGYGSITCPASGSCTVIAKYTDSSGDQEAMVAEETGGLWGQAIELASPANAASNPATTLYPVCMAPGACIAVGAYTDENGYREAAEIEETGGLWGQVSEVAAPADAAVNPEIILGEVQCPAMGSCAAFGEYTDKTSSTRDMEIFGMTTPENTMAPIVNGTAKVGQALTCSQGTWTASPTAYVYKWLRNGAVIGGAESNVYTVTAADEGHSLSCQVTATNAAGSKSATSANSVAVREEARERREEAAAGKKRKEKAAKRAVTGSVSLARSLISVEGGRGSVKLTCTGTVACAGSLKLTVAGKAKKGKKARVRVIGTAVFSIPADRSKFVAIKLISAGRRLLKADHGKLSAVLSIFKFSPSPTSTKRESVQLVQKKARR